jgi:putative oxidoreductase
MLKRISALYADALTVVEKLKPVVPTLFRVTLGIAFIRTGWGKLHHLDRIIAFFGSLGIPHPELQAPFVSGLELVGGVLVLIGLATRFISIPLMVSMVVALVTAKADDVKALPDIFTMIEYLYAIGFLYLIIEGAGPWSLDALVRRALKLPERAQEQPSPIARTAANGALGSLAVGLAAFLGFWFLASHNPCDRVPQSEPFAQLVKQSKGSDEDAADTAMRTCHQVLRWQAQGKDAAAELKKQAESGE